MKMEILNCESISAISAKHDSHLPLFIRERERKMRRKIQLALYITKFASFFVVLLLANIYFRLGSTQIIRLLYGFIVFILY